MDIPTIHPGALRPGDQIGIIAPAGTVEDRTSFYRSVAALERLGFAVRYDERIFESERYLAGQDEARAEELHRYFEDPAIRAVIPLRGGYGCARLVPLLDEKRLRPHCKLFMGFSDITTLHLFFGRRFGWVTLHGPMMTSAMLADPAPAQKQHIVSLWTDPQYRPILAFPGLEPWHPGTAEGRLVGGCLSIILASLGTCYEVKTEGKILLIEDCGEEPYRVDRMLTQLQLAGKLDGLAGILVGSFANCDPEEDNYKVRDTLRDILLRLGVPILAGFPAGHGAENWPLSLGVRVRLNADAGTLENMEAAVR